MAKEIKFNIKLAIDGKEQLVTATYDVRKLQEVVNSARDSATRFRDVLITYNQAVDAIRNVADVFEPLRESLSRYGRGMAQAAQLTGLAGDELRVLGNQAQAMSSAFGTDINETMLAANSLAKGFGITAQDAMRLVQDGMVSGANANGQFLDVLKEYPRYFKEAGISAEAFVAITTNAARQGVFSDKGVDAIKEANIRLREMTPATQAALEGIGMSAEAVQQALRDGSATTFEVMQNVAMKLRELPAASSEVGTALADIFGGPGEDAGLEYIKTLADIETDMGKVKAGADDYSKSLGRQADAMAAVSNRITSLIDLTRVFGAVAPALNVASQVGMSVVAITSMANSLKALATAQSVVQVRAMAFNAACVAWRKVSLSVVAITRTLSATLRGVAVSATTAKVALRGLMSATVIGAAIAALGIVLEKLVAAFDGAGDAAEDAAGKLDDFKDGADTVSQAYDTTLKSTYSGLMSKYEAPRAKAAAYAAKAASLYEKHVQLTESRDAIAKGIADDARRSGRNARAGDVIPESWRNERYGSVDRQGVWRFSESGAKLYSGTDVTSNAQWQQAQRAIEANQREIDKTRGMVEALSKEASQTISPSTGEKATTITTTSATPTASAPSYEAGSVSWYEERIRELERRISSTADVGAAKATLPELTMARAGLHDLKVRIGLEDPVQPVAIARSVNEQLQTEIKPIEIPVDTSELEKGRGSIEGATDALRSLGGALSSAGRAMELPALDVAGTIAAAIATTIMGFADASKQEGKLGIWGWIAASAAGLANLMAVVGSIKAMGAFANGGVVSGPTLALVGEYAGAGSNPEVIAPLDRLRSMLNPPVAASLGAVRFEVEGRKLVGVMANETRTAAKSGRRTNIRI